MKLNEILKLETTYESLNIIQAYLSESLSINNYQAAMVKYLKIANKLELDELVVEQGLLTINKFNNQLISKYEEKIYKYMISSYIRLENFSEAKKYINKRKLILPIIDQYLTLLDELDYKKALNEDYLDTLKTLTIETTPHNIKTYAYEELLKYYLNKQMYDYAYDTIILLNNHSNSKKYEAKKLYILYMQKQYEKVIQLGEEKLKENKDNIEIAIYLIASYKNISRYQKAINYEAEYEKRIDLLDDYQLKKFAYQEILDLYKKVNNVLSISLYEEKLEKLNKEFRVKKTNKKQKSKEIKIIKPVTKSSSNIKYLQHFSYLKKWLIFSHQIDSKLALREYFRSFFIEVNKKINLKEVIIYLKNEKESNFFNYKKERLYDKKIIDPYIENTVIEDVLNKNDFIFGNPETLTKNKDVLTQKPYSKEIKYIYAFPLTEDGVIVFYLEEEILDPSIYYELYDGISKIIDTRLINEKIIKRYKNETLYLNKIVENPLVPIRVMSNTKSSYNQAAQDFFKIDKYYHFELFIQDIPIDDASKYKSAVNRLLNYPNETKVINYKYQNREIIEYMYAVKKKDVEIISFFIDNTKNKLIKKDLLNIALKDNETNLLSKYSLDENINEILKDKVSFILIELNNDIKHIYGAVKMKDYFKELANITQKHFKNNVYRYNFNQILVLLPFNDIRKVERFVLEYLTVINHYESKIIPYEKFKVNIGILRYPVSSSDTSYKRLLNYLDISLNISKRKNKRYHFFEYKDYEKEVFEQQVIDYLNISLQNKDLSLMFKQVIDLKTNKIWQYESYLNIPLINIDPNYLYVIADKRNKIIDLDYYHIEAVLKFLNELEKKTKRLIKITIPISKKTVKQKDFSKYVLQMIKKYNIPNQFLRLKINTNNKNIDLSDLIKTGISIDTTSLDLGINKNYHAVHIKYEEGESWIRYYKMLNNYLNNENIALVIRDVENLENINKLKSNNIRYIQSKVYSDLTKEVLIDKIKESIK